MMHLIKRSRKPKKYTDNLHPKLKAELLKQQAIEENRQAVMRAGMSDEQLLREAILKNNPTNATSYEFRNYKNPRDVKRHNGIERTQYSGNITNPQFSISDYSEPIMHGTVVIREYGTGRVLKTDEIYVYSPRFEGTSLNSNSRSAIGPRFNKDGTIGKNPYVYMDPRNNEIYIGNIPKREIFSGRCFDFDSKNKTSFDTSCEAVLGGNHRSVASIVEVKYDYTPDGNIKTVDLSNPLEVQKLEAYKNRMQNLLVAGRVMDSYTTMIKKEMTKAQTGELEAQHSIARAQAGQKVAQEQAQTQQRMAEQAQNRQETAADRNAKDWENIVKYDIYPTVSAQVEHNQGHSHGMGQRVVSGRPMGRRPMPPGGGGRRR